MINHREHPKIEYRFEVSEDGETWKNVPVIEKISFYNAQKRSNRHCGWFSSRNFSGFEDRRSYLVALKGWNYGKKLRITFKNPSSQYSCMAEILLLKH